MNNLFAFGCSLTYGHGMEDNWDSNNNRPFDCSPSKKAWPFLLANMLNYNCINLAQPGASNKEILYILEDETYAPYYYGVEDTQEKAENEIRWVIGSYLERHNLL